MSFLVYSHFHIVCIPLRSSSLFYSILFYFILFVFHFAKASPAAPLDDSFGGVWIRLDKKTSPNDRSFENVVNFDFGRDSIICTVFQHKSGRFLEGPFSKETNLIEFRIPLLNIFPFLIHI